MTRCSALHLAEARVPLPPELEAQMQGPPDLQRHYPSSEWAVGVAAPFVNFLHVQEEAEARGLVQTTTIGRATVRYFRAAPVVALYEEMRRERPTRLIDCPA
jgi:aminoglycoside N3'-acetyltransferase